MLDFIKILDFEDLTIVKSKELDEAKGDIIIKPTNNIKVLINGNNEKHFKEGLVCFQWCGKDDEYNKIILFE